MNIHKIGKRQSALPVWAEREWADMHMCATKVNLGVTPDRRDQVPS
jgi:hypothetical protein